MLHLFEHINLNICEKSVAERFYVHGLGGKVNEPTTNERQLHVNLGLSQFHLPFKYDIVQRLPVEKPQRWPGVVHLLTLENIASLSTRLKALGYEAAESCDHCSVIGPYGNAFEIYRAKEDVSRGLGSHPSGSASLVGLSKATYLLPSGQHNLDSVVNFIGMSCKSTSE